MEREEGWGRLVLSEGLADSEDQGGRCSRGRSIHFYPAFKQDDLRHKHNKFSVVAAMGREGKL